MSNTQSTRRRRRTRPATYPEVLRAVAHVLERPRANLSYPTMTYSESRLAGYDATLLVDKFADLLAWARAMDDVMCIVVTPYGAPGMAKVEVLGTVNVAALEVWAPGTLAVSERREITVAELELLAESPVDTTELAGVS